MKSIKYILVFSFYCLFAVPTNAAIATWVGGIGDWEVNSNWDTGNVPDSDDGVIINNGTVTINNFAEANYIHLDGGNLEVHGTLLVSPDIEWYPSIIYQIRGIVIENGSSFNNYLNTIVIRPSSPTPITTATLIYCNGDLTNHANGFLFCQGDKSTGLHSYSFSGTIENYGEILMQSVNVGMYLINPFRNYGSIDIGTYGISELGIHNREFFYSSSSSTLKVNGRVEIDGNSEWIEHGSVEVNYTSSNTISHNVVKVLGLLDIKNSGSFSVEGSHLPFLVDVDATLRVRGDLIVINDKLYESAMHVNGFMVNHQSGLVSTNAYYGLSNNSNGETLNYGIWKMTDTNHHSFYNSGLFSNRPKGKLYINGRVEFVSGSTFNNQGHMFMYTDENHLDLSGQFNNTGTLNDVDNRMSAINNNTSIRVHKKAGPWTEGVPVSNVLDIGANPASTVLSWYTSSTGSTVAGTYNSISNTFTPNSNAVGLFSLFVRTRINTGGVTRRHELVVENGINGSPSPLIQPNQKNSLNSNFEMTITPNPNGGRFSINVDTQEDQLKYTIFNSIGQKVASNLFDPTSNIVQVSQYLKSGIYFVRLDNINGKYIDTKKIRIVR